MKEVAACAAAVGMSKSRRTEPILVPKSDARNRVFALILGRLRFHDLCTRFSTWKSAMARIVHEEARAIDESSRTRCANSKTAVSSMKTAVRQKEQKYISLRWTIADLRKQLGETEHRLERAMQQRERLTSHLQECRCDLINAKLELAQASFDALKHRRTIHALS